MKVTGARQPLGVAAIPSLSGGRRDQCLNQFAAWFSLLATLVIKGLQGGAKVLIEFCSDFIITHLLSAGGERVLLVSVINGLF